MSSVAFIGLGAMGGPMARRIVEHTQWELRGFDLDATRVAALPRGALACSTLEEALEGADVVFTVLARDEHLEAVSTQIAESARGVPLVVDFSTVAPATVETVRSRLQRVGVDVLGIGMTRSTAAAIDGTLALFVGTDVRPALVGDLIEAVASDVMYVGTARAAKTLKLVNNEILAGCDAAILEAMTLGRLMGINPGRLVDELDSAAPSWANTNHIRKFVLPDDLGPGRFSTEMMMKDVELAIDLAAGDGLSTSMAPALSVAYRGTVAMGLGNHFHMSLVRWLELAANVQKTRGMPVDENALPFLVDLVTLIQSQATHESVQLLAGAGVPQETGARLLLDGSARNQTLEDMANATEKSEAALDDQHRLHDALRRCRAVSYPGLFVQAAYVAASRGTPNR